VYSTRAIKCFVRVHRTRGVHTVSWRRNLNDVINVFVLAIRLMFGSEVYRCLLCSCPAIFASRLLQYCYGRTDKLVRNGEHENNNRKRLTRTYIITIFYVANNGRAYMYMRTDKFRKKISIRKFKNYRRFF